MLPEGSEDAMVTVWENGAFVTETTFAEVRARADAVPRARLEKW